MERWREKGKEKKMQKCSTVRGKENLKLRWERL